MENVNKGGWKVGKHANLWEKNAFNEWRVFWAMTQINLLLIFLKTKIMLKLSSTSFFCFASCKKKGSLHPPNKYMFLSIFWIFFHFLFLQKRLGLGFRFFFTSFKFYIIVVMFPFCAFVIIVLWFCNGSTFYVFLVGFFVASSFWYIILEDL